MGEKERLRPLEVRGVGDATAALGAAATLPCLRGSADLTSNGLTKHGDQRALCASDLRGPGQSRGLVRSKTCELWYERPLVGAETLFVDVVNGLFSTQVPEKPNIFRGVGPLHQA